MPESERARGRIPAWLGYSILTVFLWGAWGVQSKMVVEHVSPWTNQVLFPLGLVPVTAAILASPGQRAGAQWGRGASYGLLTGILGGAGNIAFFLSLERGGAASVVVPLTCMAPLVTVLLATVFLRETLTRWQLLGIPVAIAAIYLLSI